MNEQTNKQKPGYPLAKKDCTRAKLSRERNSRTY